MSAEDAAGVMSIQIDGEVESLGKDQMQNFFYTYINKDFLVADFEHNGVNYRVKADNITHYDFYKVVQSIITG